MIYSVIARVRKERDIFRESETERREGEFEKKRIVVRISEERKRGRGYENVVKDGAEQM